MFKYFVTLHIFVRYYGMTLSSVSPHGSTVVYIFLLGLLLFSVVSPHGFRVLSLS